MVTEHCRSVEPDGGCCDEGCCAGSGQLEERTELPLPQLRIR
jgi:hypothetical protein